MRCHECGGRYERRSGPLEVPDQYVGKFVVPDVEYYKCDCCDDFLFSLETAQAIERSREASLREILLSLPLAAFVTASEAAALLGISRQAMHKHRRIRRGFIFRARFGDKVVYLRESIELFKATGDGRFALRKPESRVDYTSKTATAYPGALYRQRQIISRGLPGVMYNPSVTTIPRRRPLYAS